MDGLNKKIGEALPSQLPQLRCLWKEAFGDSDVFLDIFYETAFSKQRCRCITIDGKIAAALYWFDCTFQGKQVAYIYAVATAKAHRGKGLCRQLMQDTHRYLADIGYIGAVLVPGSRELFAFYERMGYQTCCYIEEISYERKEHSNENLISQLTKPKDQPELSISQFADRNINFKLYQLTKEQFSHLRRTFLPPNAIVQENENLDFLETQAQFYLGKNFLLTASKAGNILQGLELLGDTSFIPEILQALECTKGTFRVPGNKKKFTMYFPLKEAADFPKYFGFAFD